jgi:hypothetical protein
MSFSQFDFKWTGLVGEQTLADGAEGQTRLGPQGDLLTNISGKYYEHARKGRLFHAHTAVAGVAPGTAIGTTAAAALANPSGSGKDLVVVGGFLAYLSGTLGIGFMSWIGHIDPTQAAITGTAMVAVNGRLNGSNPSGKALTTATVPASGSTFRLFANLPPILASTVLTPWRFDDYVDGEIVIPPGTGVSLQATAASGSTPKVLLGFSWLEVPEASS